MNALRWLWEPAHYWAVWLVGLIVIFAVREFWALAHGRPQDTFSWWVWQHLKISAGEGIGSWTFLDFIAFGVYCVIFTWLAGHFFWRLWRG